VSDFIKRQTKRGLGTPVNLAIRDSYDITGGYIIQYIFASTFRICTNRPPITKAAYTDVHAIDRLVLLVAYLADKLSAAMQDK